MRKGWILAPALLVGITMFLASDLFAWGDRGGKRGRPYWQGSSAEQNWSALAHDMLSVDLESVVME